MLYRQNFAVFCQTSTWISHSVYTYPLPFETPSHLPPYPTPLGWYIAPVWVSWSIQQFPLAIYFTYGNVSSHVALSIHLSLSSPLPMSIRLFSVILVFAFPLCFSFLSFSFFALLWSTCKFFQIPTCFIYTFLGILGYSLLSDCSFYFFKCLYFIEV